jgi:hypothetical protein
VSPAYEDRGGLPRGRGWVSPAGTSGGIAEDLLGANQAKADKLRRNELTRRARARGLELRRSAYGYALIDAARNQIEDRNDMTLDEVESRLTPP